MTKLDQIRAAESKLLLPTYERNPILFVGGEGVHLIDEKGDEYLDLLSGIGVNALGYGHPAIEEAIASQSKSADSYFEPLLSRGPGGAGAAADGDARGMDRVFFCNTGTEAWEGALKLARAHAGLLRSEGKQIGTKFLALEQSFHGRTYGSVATTLQGEVSRAVWAGDAGRGVCALQRCR